MVLVNPSELLSLLAAVPKSAFPLPGATQPCTPLLCGMGTRALQAWRGVCIALPEAPGQGAEHSWTYHPWGAHPPHTPSRWGSGLGSQERMAEQYGWHCAGPDPWGPPCCCGHPPVPLPPRQGLARHPAGTHGAGRAHVRGSGTRRVLSEQGQEEEGCCLFFHLLPPQLTSPPSFHPPPCAGMKQPHLEIPSLLKARSTRQRTPFGKPLHYMATRRPGGTLGMGGLGGGRRDVGHQPSAHLRGCGAQTFADPPGDREQASSRQECLPEPGKLRMLL